MGTCLRYAILLLLTEFVGYGHAEPNKVQYELQERCGKGASEFFEKEYGNGAETFNGGGYKYTFFENHYSARLNKCFILITQNISLPNNKPPLAGFITRISIVDVNERKEYGSFEMWNGNDVHHCYFAVYGKFCHSETEWEALTKSYMDDAN